MPTWAEAEAANMANKAAVLFMFTQLSDHLREISDPTILPLKWGCDFASRDTLLNVIDESVTFGESLTGSGHLGLGSSGWWEVPTSWRAPNKYAGTVGTSSVFFLLRFWRPSWVNQIPKVSAYKCSPATFPVLLRLQAAIATSLWTAAKHAKAKLSC